ncbi:MAG: glutamine synthetase beta-grasp domain-containing protein [Oscillospiraceae bacterium]|jgi:glutamine synthetase|nr:glutamine synthetase beta-grasp domain-containing protein [Oscillospiraceae bacterium]
MPNTHNDVLRFVTDPDNDIKFVRLAFSDADGVPKNISVSPDALTAAFRDGVAFDGRILGDGGGQPLLFPDPETLAALPWRPSHGCVVRLYCDICYADGSPAPCDARASLRRAADGLSDGTEIGVSLDFYLFRSDADGAATRIPLDAGGYLDVYPLDRGENVRREICSYLREMGVSTSSSFHAYGPGQNTVTLAPAAPAETADNIQTLKTVLGAVAGQNGLAASLEPRPLPGTSESMLWLALRRGGDTEHLSINPQCNPYAEIEKLLRGAKNRG